MNVGLGFAAGALTGAISGMPLGVVNVAIVDAALAQENRYALGLGIGGALADTVHASLAFLGLATLITKRPELERILALVAGAVILVFAILSWRRHRERSTKTYEHPTVLRGLASGISITLPNPAALAAWVAVASAVPAGSTDTAIAAAVGAGIGSVAWFILLGNLVGRLSPHNRFIEWLPKIAIVVFVAIAVYGIVRAFS
ncbi:MAG TPA: LysE family transporter [Kofleriaceae bacterium]|jgi:threonine/homoserine/homoserine lactone efflux protein